MTTRKKPKPRMKEVDLAKIVVDWLLSEEWDVYQEVQVETYGRVADIVAIRAGIVWIIETKMSLSIDAIEQAWQWNMHAHFVSVASPSLKETRGAGRNKGRDFTHRVLDSFGIGCLEIDSECGQIWQSVKPALNREGWRYVRQFRESLHPKQRKYAKAGNAKSQHFTPFRDTCDSLRVIVNRTPGITMKEAVDSLKSHHYRNDATALSALRKWIGLRKVKGIRSEIRGGKMRLYPR